MQRRRKRKNRFISRYNYFAKSERKPKNTLKLKIEKTYRFLAFFPEPEENGALSVSIHVPIHSGTTKYGK